MMKPGVQKPHISASLSQNACCTGCSVSPLARPVDGANLLALHLDRQRRAGVDRAAVDDHRAGAAGAAIAAALVAGEVGAHAQRVEQRHARLDHQIDLPAVHRETHRHFAGADRGRAALCAASAGATTVAARPTTPVDFRKLRRLRLTPSEESSFGAIHSPLLRREIEHTGPLYPRSRRG